MTSGTDPAAATGWRRGVRLGVDVGKVRVGVARSDPDGILATPLATLARDLTAAGPSATPSSATRRAASRPAASRPAASRPAAPGPAGVEPAAEGLPAGGGVPGGDVPAGGVPADRLPVDIGQLVALVREHEAVEVVVGLPVTLAGREALAAADARGYAEILSHAIAPIPVRLSDERMTTKVASRRLSERGVRGRRQRAVVDQVAAVEILQGWLDNQRRRA